MSKKKSVVLLCNVLLWVLAISICRVRVVVFMETSFEFFMCKGRGDLVAASSLLFVSVATYVGNCLSLNRPTPVILDWFMH